MNEEFAILLFFFGISATTNLALAIGAFRAARRVRRLENHMFGPASGRAPDDARVERLEQAVDTIDARLDQLVRGQEFLSKLVSERRHAIAPREREVTPH
jgi:hypothetical protein